MSIVTALESEVFLTYVAIVAGVLIAGGAVLRITSYNVCYTKLLR